MLQSSSRTIQKRQESDVGYHLALRAQIDDLFGRLHDVEALLKEVRGWFSPYSSAEKWCVLCGAEMAEPHTDACPYPKWAERVTYLIGPK